MATFNELHEVLKGFPGLGDAVGMEKAMEFIQLTASLKDAILTAQPVSHSPDDIPSEMPEHVCLFVGLSMDMPEHFVEGCWSAFSDVIWCFEDGQASKWDTEKFKEYGLDHW
ncbi:hypothetical protein L208DRAFT_1462549 [Tricholoma matsutake]|nr:hypothetical protein L208DRAFT_1462549 [Tricholoma matsutake 945]